MKKREKNLFTHCRHWKDKQTAERPLIRSLRFIWEVNGVISSLHFILFLFYFPSSCINSTICELVFIKFISFFSRLIHLYEKQKISRALCHCHCRLNNAMTFCIHSHSWSLALPLISLAFSLTHSITLTFTPTHFCWQKRSQCILVLCSILNLFACFHWKSIHSLFSFFFREENSLLLFIHCISIAPSIDVVCLFPIRTQTTKWICVHRVASHLSIYRRITKKKPQPHAINQRKNRMMSKKIWML